MAGRSRVHRGRKTEKVVAEYLQEQGYPYALATGAGRSGSDITGIPWACEIKARSDFQPVAWLRQAQAGAADGTLPMCVVRPNGVGEDASKYLAFLTFADFVDLWRKAHP